MTVIAAIELTFTFSLFWLSGFRHDFHAVPGPQSPGVNCKIQDANRHSCARERPVWQVRINQLI
jgi:hypothetical protein